MMEAVLARIRQLPSVQQRRAAAMIGAIVADVAVTPLHWIYDQSKVAGLVASGTTEFSQTSHCPFYTVPAGDPSAYGVQIQLTIEGLVEDNGFDAAKQADRFFKTFGPGTPFEAVRKQTGSPKQGCWTNQNIKIFLAKREEGEGEQSDTNSQDPDGLVKAIGVIGMYHGRSEMEAKVEECVRVTQSHPVAVRYALAAARILSGIIGTGEQPSLDTISSALEQSSNQTDKEAASDIKKATAAVETSHPVLVKKYGLQCGMPPSFIGMMHGLAGGKSYTEAVRDEILTGGDICCRSAFIGACVAARCGLDCIPVEWMQKVNRIETLLKWVEILAKF